MTAAVSVGRFQRAVGIDYSDYTKVNRTDMIAYSSSLDKSTANSKLKFAGDDRF